MKSVIDERCCRVADWLAADEAALDYIATTATTDGNWIE